MAQFSFLQMKGVTLIALTSSYEIDALTLYFSSRISYSGLSEIVVTCNTDGRIEI